METSEEFLTQIQNGLSSSGMEINKETLKSSLLEPGKKRLELIKWMLQKMDITVGNQDVTKVVLECGLCPPSKPNIVLGNCSASDNIEFWKRLVHFVTMCKGTKQTSGGDASNDNEYLNMCKFWMEWSASDELKNMFQSKKKKNVLSPKIPCPEMKGIEVDDLKRKQMAQVSLIRKLEKERDTQESTEDEDGDSSSESVSFEEVEKLGQKINSFKLMFNSLILNTSQITRLDESSEGISDLLCSVQKIITLCEDAKRIMAGLESLSITKIDESTLSEIPNFGMQK
ncbi:uncharacterized protein [Periplaneta americana]|uniref:uncharacterized protein n=1 Tax=Periplaneta americana TaxID=6978 RepID=UPI0037E86FBB